MRQSWETGSSSKSPVAANTNIRTHAHNTTHKRAQTRLGTYDGVALLAATGELGAVPKVGDLNAAVGAHQQVVRLNVAVNDALGVQRLQALAGGGGGGGGMDKNKGR